MEELQETPQLFSCLNTCGNTSGSASISGDFLICNTNETYTLNNVQSGANISWSKSNNLTYLSGQATTSYQVKPTTTSTFGVAWVEASISGIGCDNIVIRKEIQLSKFSTSDMSVSGTPGVCPGNWYTYYSNVPGGHQAGYTYQWIKPANWTIQSQGQNYITLSVPQYSQPDYGTVSARVNNGCGGWSNYSGLTVYPGYGCGGSGYYSYSVYPNPTSGILTIEAIREEVPEASVLTGSEENALAESVEIEEFDYALYDMVGSPVRIGQSSDLRSSIDTSGFKKGMYHLRIVHKGQEETRTVIVE